MAGLDVEEADLLREADSAASLLQHDARKAGEQKHDGREAGERKHDARKAGEEYRGGLLTTLYCCSTTSLQWDARQKKRR